jgi:hypothetical protein
MLDITSGDTAALTEITDVQDLLLRLGEPDLSALGRLNVHRSRIADLNAHAPSILPVVWAMIGYPDRGEALAQAIISPDRRTRALADLVRAAAGAGDLDRATASARSIPDPDEQVRALVGLAEKAESNQARSLLARALVSGHWSASIDVLLQINPTAVRGIADEYLSAASSPGNFPQPSRRPCS